MRKKPMKRTTMYTGCCNVEAKTDYEHFNLGYSMRGWKWACPKCKKLNPGVHPMQIEVIDGKEVAIRKA